MKMSLNDLVSIFTSPRDDHPGRKGLQRRKFRGKSHRKGGAGNSKWHRRMVACGLK